MFRNQEDARRDYNTSAIQFGGSEMTRTAGLEGEDYSRYADRYDAERTAPIKEMASLGQASQYTPRTDPYQFSPMATVDFGRQDVGGAVGQFQQYDIQKAQLRKMGSGGGGGGGGGGSTTALDNSLIGLLEPSGYAPQGPSTGQRITQGIGQGLGTGLAISGSNAGRRGQNAMFRSPY